MAEEGLGRRGGKEVKDLRKFWWEKFWIKST
jgi:hypothetical protein